ncbi:unnamed protein product [Camellia sinensis]
MAAALLFDTLKIVREVWFRGGTVPLKRFWSLSLGFVVLIRSPQQWQSDKLGRSLVFLQNRLEDKSDDRAELDDAAAAAEPCFLTD